MQITDDPYNDFIANEIEKEEWLEKLPRCECCGGPIQQEKAIYYNDQWCCNDCSYDFWDEIKEDFLERIETDG